MIFYKFVTLIYSKFITLYEKLFLKNQNQSNDLLISTGYQKFKFKQNFIDKLDLKETIRVNNYLEKLVLNEEYIFSIIEKTFIQNNLTKKISEITGFNYSIDFLTAYRTYLYVENKKKKIIMQIIACR